MAFTEDSYTESIGITGDLTVDSIKINGATIGHKNDSDLLTFAVGGLTVDGTITSTGNLIGDVTGRATTVSTIAGLAPDTPPTGTFQLPATAAAQTNITSVGTLTGLDVTGQSNFTVTDNDASGFTILNSAGSGYKLNTYEALGPFFELIENTAISGRYPYMLTRKTDNTELATQTISVAQHKYENDSGTERTLVQIEAISVDDTNNSEKGAWQVGIRNGASSAGANTRLQVDADGITVTGRVKANTFEALSQTPWQVTNHTTDRAFNANSTTTEELADVLGTLINDLITLGLIKAL